MCITNIRRRRIYILILKEGSKSTVYHKNAKRNLPCCKELIQYVELRLLDKVKGNITISETEYIATFYFS